MILVSLQATYSLNMLRLAFIEDRRCDSHKVVLNYGEI